MNNTQQNTLTCLAAREREIFDFMIKGMRTKDISETLNLKPNTVSTVKKVIFRKLQVNSTIELYKIAQDCHLV